MAEPIRGAAGAGSVDVYEVPRDHSLRLDLITFTLTTDATAGVHSAMVTLTDSTVAAPIAQLWDWNEGGPTQTLVYTFGVGLKAFNCTVTTGMRIEHPLPVTILAPETLITITALNNAGVTIAGDAISGVILYGELLDVLADAQTTLPDLAPGLLPAAAA